MTEMAGQQLFREPFSGIELIAVRGGSYAMGDGFGDGFDNERPVHPVTVSDYLLGRTPVTQGQWQQVMGTNPAVFAVSPDHPVESVSWADVQAFIAKINALPESGGGYRLPTEAEWEYAARSGGNAEKWPGTSDPQAARDHCWFDENGDYTTHAVGLKHPNGLGFYDMGGNVFELCADVYADDAYLHHAQVNPLYGGPGADCLLRGGSWYSYLLLTRCTDRSRYGRNCRDRYVGFRLARSITA